MLLMPLPNPYVRPFCSRERCTSSADRRPNDGRCYLGVRVAEGTPCGCPSAGKDDIAVRRTTHDTWIGGAARRDISNWLANSPAGSFPGRDEFDHSKGLYLSLSPAAVRACVADTDETAVPELHPFRLGRSATMESTTETTRRVCPRRYRGGEGGQRSTR